MEGMKFSGYVSSIYSNLYLVRLLVSPSVPVPACAATGLLGSLPILSKNLSIVCIVDRYV